MLVNRVYIVLTRSTLVGWFRFFPGRLLLEYTSYSDPTRSDDIVRCTYVIVL